MDEDEYKETYLNVNTLMCPFEKAVLSTQCGCEKSARIFIADRQAVGCSSQTAQQTCTELLQSLRRSAVFALKMTGVPNALPHAKEMKVQCGGLIGLQAALHPGQPPEARVENVYRLLEEARGRYGSLGDLPFSEIMKAVSSYQGRRRAGPRR